MASLHITLLGPFGAALSDGTPVQIETRKARAVLAILLMSGGRPVPRERLAGMLWSRGETRQALASLSQALYSLRLALDDILPGLIQAETEAVSLDAAGIEVDALTVMAVKDETTEEASQRCLELYRGAFLEDLVIDQEEGYSDWRVAEQARLEEIATRVGSRLMAAWEARPDATKPELVDRLLGIEPYSEAAVRVKMRCLALEGRTAAALEVAERFTAQLSGDLQIAPGQDMSALIETIRRGDIGADEMGPVADVSGTFPRRRIVPVIGATLSFVAALFWFWLYQGRLPASDEMRVLVRPFATGPGVDEPLAEGFGDDLSTALVRRAALDVLSRESGRMIPEGAERESGATHVLGGRLRMEDESLVLNLWLIDLDDGREVWAGRFDGEMSDLRGFRSSVIESVGDQIDLALLPSPGPPPVVLPADAVPDYLRAIGLLHAGAPGANAEAIGSLTSLLAEHPLTPEPSAALALAYERVAFGTDDYALAAGMHWLEGYLALKVLLASSDSLDPGLLSVRARLALHRLDLVRAEALARQALRLDPTHVNALSRLGETLALSGETEEAISLANRAIALAPAAPGESYAVLALANFAAGRVAEARMAAKTGIDLSRTPSPTLLAIAAATAALEGDLQVASSAYSSLVAAVQSRPFGAWRLGDITYNNPRATTWRRPRGEEVAWLIGFSDRSVQARLRRGLHLADPTSRSPEELPEVVRLSSSKIEAELFGKRIVGRASWLVQEEWSQVRTEAGELFQTGAFGPLPGAQEGQSHVFEDRLCGRWLWQGEQLENCQLVFRYGPVGNFLLRGETGVFEALLVDDVN